MFSPLPGAITPAPSSGGGVELSYVHLQASTIGRGSTNTTIARFQTVVSSAGSDLTVTDSSTDGTYVTVNTAGTYAVWAAYPHSGAANVGIKKAAVLNNTFATSDGSFQNGYTYMSSNGIAAAEFECEVGDKIWVAHSGALGSAIQMSNFRVRRVA